MTRSGMRVIRTRLGKNFNEGARLLWLAMQSRDESQETVREALGVSKGVVGRWLIGERKPGREAAAQLFDRYEIPLEAWDAKPTRAFRAVTTHRTGTEG